MFLGSVTSLETITFDTGYYVSIEVNSNGEMSPRIRLSASGYAFRAKHADTAYALSGEVIADSSLTVTDTAVFNGRVGIGTTDPATALDVGGTLLIFASGSGYNNSSGQQIGMSIKVDNIIKGYAQSFSNEAGSHKVFSCNALVVSGIAAGSHTLSLESWNGTITDANDFFSATVLELPF